MHLSLGIEDIISYLRVDPWALRLYHPEATGVPGENHRKTLSHNVVSRTPRHERGSNSQL
jgi:hypothetical protein